MATVTLVANTNYSALTVADGDTIDCAGFQLTINIQPAQTGVFVVSPATAGTVSISGAYDLSTWSFTGGTVTFIATVPIGASLGTVTAGSGTFAHGVGTNNGTITTVNGATTGSGGQGVQTNNGTVGTANGGAVASAFGVTTNNGTVTTSNGGTASNVIGVSTNNGTITTANGGTATGTHGVATNSGTVSNANGSGFAHGVNTNNRYVGTANGGAVGHGVAVNNGSVGHAIGGLGASAYGILFNNGGLVLRLTANVGMAVSLWNGAIAFVEGPYIDGVIPSNIKTIYSLGPLSGDATIAGDATVIEMAEGSGGGFRRQGMGGGFPS